jgi:hypothetical protein
MPVVGAPLFSDVAFGAGAVVLQPLVKPDAGGWITLPVTDLVFPPWCAECGAPTLDRQPFRAHHSTGFALILIPVCETCQKAFRRNYRRAFWKPFSIVLLVAEVAGFAIGTIPVLTGRDPRSFPILSILCALGLAVVVVPLAWVVLMRRALRAAPPPVQVRRYIRNQQVTFRFRRPEYTADILSLLGSRPRSAER